MWNIIPCSYNLRFYSNKLYNIKSTILWTTIHMKKLQFQLVLHFLRWSVFLKLHIARHMGLWHNMYPRTPPIPSTSKSYPPSGLCLNPPSSYTSHYHPWLPGSLYSLISWQLFISTIMAFALYLKILHTIYMATRVHTHTHTLLYKYSYTYTYTYIVNVCTHTHTHVYIHVSIEICVY